MAHTPGPWFSSSHRIGHCVSVTFTSDKGNVSPFVAICPFMADLEDFTHEAGTNEANARLIAAAPDLLEALEEVADPGFKPDVFWFQKVRAAIAKAKGEAP